MKAIRESSSSPPSPLVGSFLSNLPQSLENVFQLASENEERHHFGLISMALLFLGHGLTDEAHDIVTPLSWPEDTHFGYGPSVYSQVSLPARSYATYVHCLVHRREAFNVGEFGMVGFSNANYWSNAVLKSPGVDSLPHADLLNQVGQLARQWESTPGVADWCQQHGLLKAEGKPFFESRAVHELCANVLSGKSPELQDFAERVAETEVRILLGHALQHAGYECDMSMVLKRDDDNEIPPAEMENVEMTPVDESRALSAARRVSSAHLSMFQTDGLVTIRNVMGGESGSPISAAAGVACRLLESPACRAALPTISQETAIRIVLPMTPEQAASISMDRDSSSAGFLASGDLHATRFTLEDSPAVVANGPWYAFVACDPTDARACYVDRLFGSRGETPTSVVQWSKGTIF